MPEPFDLAEYLGAKQGGRIAMDGCWSCNDCDERGRSHNAYGAATALYIHRQQTHVNGSDRTGGPS